MISEETFGRYSLFAGLSEATLHWLGERLGHERYCDGEVIVAQGETGGRVFFIEEGAVEIRVDGQNIAQLGVGEQFGEMYLIDMHTRSASVRARGDCWLLTLGNATFLELRRSNPDAFTVLLMNCARDISRRLRESNHRLAMEIKERAAGN